MKVKSKQLSPNEAFLEVIAESADLDSIKEDVLKGLRADVKVPGFRADKAPLNLVEKYANNSLLQSEFIDQAINRIYTKAIIEAKLRTVDQPKITVKKFVPFTQLEFEATVPVIGSIELPDYKKMKFAKPEAQTVKSADIDAVLANIRRQLATKADVARAAKLGDEVWIDFSGTDSKGVEVPGGSGQNYALVLGSKTFIDGFEDNLVGLSAGDEKEFTLKFPADYGAAQLRNEKVKFKVNVIKVQSVSEPKLDDKLAAQAGPFKNLAELKADIKKQLESDRQIQARRDYESKLILAISEKTKMSMPESLVSQEVERLVNSQKRNLLSRGQTFNEFLQSISQTEEDYIKKEIIPEATQRLKASIILSEIAAAEEIKVSRDEINRQLTQLRQQYNDQNSLEELAKPEVADDIASRLLAEKTIAKIASYTN